MTKGKDDPRWAIHPPASLPPEDVTGTHRLASYDAVTQPPVSGVSRAKTSSSEPPSRKAVTLTPEGEAPIEAALEFPPNEVPTLVEPDIPDELSAAVTTIPAPPWQEDEPEGD